MVEKNTNKKSFSRQTNGSVNIAITIIVHAQELLPFFRFRYMIQIHGFKSLNT